MMWALTGTSMKTVSWISEEAGPTTILVWSISEVNFTQFPKSKTKTWNPSGVGGRL